MRAKTQDSQSVRQGKRRDRHALRQGLWQASTLPRLRHCGRRKIDGDRCVEAVAAGGVAHLANVQLCGSVHACPVCGPRIRAHRAEEIERGLGRWLGDGGGCEFVTCTLPHDKGDRLAPLLKAVAESWSAVTSGRAWAGELTGEVVLGRRERRGGLRQRLGVAGTIRALEVTCGCNGWHPHVHVLVLTERPLDEVQRADLVDHVAGVWGRSVARYGYREPSEAHGVTVSPVTCAGDVARYTAKVDDERGISRVVGNEMARHDFKTGRRKGRAPFELLASAVVDGDAGDLELWHEYERAITGQKAIVWSNGLKARLGVEEVDDKDAGLDVGGTVVVQLSEREWRALCLVPHSTAGFLDSVEAGPVPARDYLRALVDRYEEQQAGVGKAA